MRRAGSGVAVWAALLIAAPLLAACAPTRPEHPGGAFHVVATPLPLDAANPKRDRVGDFVFAGAIRLTSQETTHLGGLSDLKVSDDGQLVAESDEGTLLRARILLAPQGRLVGLDQARLTPLLGEDGKPLPSKWAADAEGVAVWPNGDQMVSFERDHRIWLYPAAGGPPRTLPKPPIRMPDNDGMEGLALAPKEGPDAYWVGVEGGSIWLCHMATRCEQPAGQFPPPSRFRLPSLFEMANGDLVVEHQHWDPVEGVHVIVSVIENPAANPAPKLIAQLRLDPPLTVDNFEGVAVVERPGGVHRFYLISDDNFRSSQQTILMAFDWKPEGGAP